MICSPVAGAVRALTPKDVMPKWCRTGRYGWAAVGDLVYLLQLTTV
jgi:hypothetical protein